jgi:hypothetical protein
MLRIFGMRKLAWITVVAALVACKEKGMASGADAGEPLRTKIGVPPQPPRLKKDEPPVPPDAPPPQVHPGPTRGAESAVALARALVEAAKKQDVTAFLDLTVSGRDIALSFHPAVQAGLRRDVASLPRHFVSWAQQVARDAEFAQFKPGLFLDFRRGQGAREKMPGYVSSEVIVKSGAKTQTFPLARAVQIGGRWKILEL